MGDRICVMKDGVIMQVARPLELYNRPANLFVAGFIGSPPMNFIRGTVRSDGGQIRFSADDDHPEQLAFAMSWTSTAAENSSAGRRVILGIRPEHIRESITDASVGGERVVLDAEIALAEPMGAETYVHFSAGGTNCVARLTAEREYRHLERLRVTFDLSQAHFFDAETEQALR